MPNNNSRPVARKKQSVQVAETGPCDYTVNRLQIYLDKLKWFKTKGLYIKYKIKPGILNKYLGTVQTSININNKCAYKAMMDGEITNLVTLITGLQSVEN